MPGSSTNARVPELALIDPLARRMPTRRHVLLTWLASAPLVPPALGLVAGIAVDNVRAIPLAASLACFCIAGVVLSLRRRPHDDAIRHAAVAFAALALGAVLHDFAYRRWSADTLVRYCDRTPTPARVRGVVLAAPALRHPRMGSIQWLAQETTTRLLIDATEIEGIAGFLPVSGAVAVKVDEPVLTVRPGDRVELFGVLYHPMPPEESQGRDWVIERRRDGILVEMSCDHAANVRVLSSAPSLTSGRGWLARVRQRARAAMLDRTYPGEAPGSNLLETLVLGQRSAVDPNVNQAFVDTGTVHYLSVSGAHVGMLASVLWIIAVALGLSRRSTALWIAVVITLYGTLAEPNPPVWRSVIMGDLLCGASLLRRPVRVANSLSAAAIVLLVWSPTDLFDPGFQLSFGTLISLIYLGPPIGHALLRAIQRARGVTDPLLTPRTQRLFNPHWSRRAGWWLEQFVALSLGVGIAAWVASLAWSAYHFSQVSLWGWLNTLLLAPLVWLALVFGLLKTVLGTLLPFAGGWLGVPLSFFTNRLIDAVNLLAGLPGSPLPPIYVGPVGVAVFTVLWAAWLVREWLRLPVRTMGVITLALALIAAWRLAPPAPSNTLTVQILSVGSGSAHLITLPDGRTLLYDLGARPPYDVERWTLAPTLARRNIYQIDALLLSHPDLDHFSSVPDLLKRHRVREVIAAPSFRELASRDGPSGYLVELLERERLPWLTMTGGLRLRTSSVTDDALKIECLWPPPHADLPATISTNDTSLVLRISYAGKSILLCGDAQGYAQQRLIEAGDLHADVIVLPHHGDCVETTGAFLDAVKPMWCIRSSGQRDADTINGLLRLMRGRRYLNTAEAGSVTIRLSASGVDVTSTRAIAD